jgi:sugar phosphate permease
VLYPVIAKDVLHVGPDVLGVMWGAMGAGSLVGVIMASNLAEARYQRAILTGGQLMLGVAMLGFALSNVYWLSLAFLFALGVGSSAFNVAIQQNLQMLVPNDFRGRVLGIWSIVHSSIRPLGEVQFSGIAAAATAPFAVVFGGTMAIGSALFFSIYRYPIQRLTELREAAGSESVGRHH